MSFWDFFTSATAPWWSGVFTALVGAAATYFVTVRAEGRSTKRDAEIRAEERADRARAQNRAALIVDFRGMLSLTEHYIVRLSTIFVGRTPIEPGFTIEEYEDLMSFTRRFYEFLIGIEVSRAAPLIVAASGLFSVVRDFKFDFENSEAFKDYIGRLRRQADNLLQVGTKYLNFEKLSADDIPKPDWSARDREVIDKAMSITAKLKEEHPEWYR